MNSLLVAGGVAAIFLGLYSMLYPQGRHVRNWVSPKEWQRNPEKAAERQAKIATWVGAVVVLGGSLLVLVGLLM